MHPTTKVGKRRLSPACVCRVASVSLAPATDRAVRARMDAARARGELTSFSNEIRRAVAEADGNQSRLRHDLRGPLNNITLAVHLLRGSVGRREDVESLDAIARAAADMTAALAAPTR